jgi:HAD superfamily hydrolase (TIGR01509 family)
MAQLKALFFDQDGTIIDTEKDGHRVAFNRAFKEFGLPMEWDVVTYRELLQTAGGKERMRAYLHTKGFGKPVPLEKEDELVLALHKRKTDILTEMLAAGELPLRPGVRRLMREAKERGMLIGICTTSNEKIASMIADTMLKGVAVDLILAGDIVSRKKPDPEIYYLALETTGLRPEECFIIEDSKNGVEAARAAGMAVIATTNIYTEKEDLSSADIVVTCLGDPDGEKGQLKQGSFQDDFAGVVTIDHLIEHLWRTKAVG